MKIPANCRNLDFATNSSGSNLGAGHIILDFITKLTYLYYLTIHPEENGEQLENAYMFLLIFYMRIFQQFLKMDCLATSIFEFESLFGPPLDKIS